MTLFNVLPFDCFQCELYFVLVLIFDLPLFHCLCSWSPAVLFTVRSSYQTCPKPNLKEKDWSISMPDQTVQLHFTSKWVKKKKKRSIFKLVDVLESQVKSNRLNLLSKWEYFQLVGAHLLPTTIEKLIETSLKLMFTIFTVHHIMTSSNNRKDSFWNSFTIAGWTQFTSSCNSAVVIPCSLLTCNSSPVPVPSGWNPPPPPPPPFDSVSELNLQHWIFGT